MITTKNIFRFLALLVGLSILSLFIMIVWHLNNIDLKVVDEGLQKGKVITIQVGKGKMETQVKEYLPLKYSQLPELLKKRYLIYYRWDNKLNRTSIIKAMLRDVIKFFAKDFAQESLFCQKIARNSLMINKHSVPFETEIAVLEEKIAERYSKEKILELYINQLYFGQGVFGMEAAAGHFFGKHLVELEPDQLALLIGIALDNYGVDMEAEMRHYLRPEKYLQKYRDQELDVMVQGNLLSAREAEAYKMKPLKLKCKR